MAAFTAESVRVGLTPCIRWIKVESKICVRSPDKILWTVTRRNVAVKKGYNAYVR